MDEVRTLIAHIVARASREPTAPALWGQVDGEWRRLNQALFGSSIRQAAKGLVKLDVAPGDVVAVLGANRPEWAVAQYGIQSAGATVAAFPSELPDDALARELAELRPRVLFVDAVENLLRADPFGTTSKRALHVVILDAVTAQDPRVLTFDDLMVHGASVQDELVEERLQAITPEGPALRLMRPSGGWQEWTHGELLEAARTHGSALGPTDRVLSQLSPSSWAEQLYAFAIPALVGCPVWFVGNGEADATWTRAHPTVAIGDAESWARRAALIREGLAGADGVRGPFLRWAASTERQAQIEGRGGLGRKLARALVIDELRERLGLDALSEALTTEAVDPETSDALASAGVLLREFL